MRHSLYAVEPGSPLPLGATSLAEGVNFAIFSRHAEAMRLCLYESSRDELPSFEYRLDPRLNRTGDIWHVLVPELRPGALYLWRAEGPFLPRKGHRFNPHKALLDPYAKALTGDFAWELSAARAYDPASPEADLSYSAQDDAGSLPKCVVVSDEFDWGGDRPLNYPLRHCVIYEAHVKGLSRHPSSGVAHPGSYRGVVESIPRLKALGVTSLELLPVQEFDELENPRSDPRTGERLRNYWGYSTMAFFAPKGSYSSAGSRGEQVAEFKAMVRELHAAGIELILDIVFNHSAEGSELGPTLSFRGLDNPIYYILDEDRRYYKNYSGCGNTLNCNHPVVRTLIRDCLHYWVVDMHVDGFRFDLGSILGRDQTGKLLENPPIIEGIAEDPILRHTKIIAEAWDAGGAYQVGWFPGGRWAEWNDRYRDDVRRFWRGDPGAVRNLATRITGSSDLYLRDGRKPFHSINFVTAHDGFTLNDLVSYERKRNEANGEAGRDGSDANLSANYGEEGPTRNAAIEATREKQAKNFLATLLLSIGTPMILAGDELRRTQGGNNNAYCQDNPTSWIDWALAAAHPGLYRFAAKLVELRLRHPSFRRPEFFTGQDADYNACPDITWFDETGANPDWARAEHRLAARIDGSKADILADRDDNDFYLIFNAAAESALFSIGPAPLARRWYRVVDTSLPSPEDLLEPGEELPLLPQDEYAVAPRSLVLLLSKPE
ncbi:MAG TPA: glycogen debranching protein GlgX [Spirochaetales bacterium]|nr:glycogen debranching protein GlgX [Spirochaetales bacterium]HRY54826.1 glycogen debranching protein GlgX [Spirochaetia bacterium]